MASSSTAAATVIAFDKLARQTGASADIVNYLTARNMNRTPTLALLAADEGAFVRAVVEPLLNQFTDASGVVHKVADGNRHVAKAVLLHLWMEAQRQ